MCRRKLSAVISSSRASPCRCHGAASTVRTKTWCCVSVGVNARKSCSREDVRGVRERLLVEGARSQQLRASSNGDGVRRRQMR